MMRDSWHYLRGQWLSNQGDSMVAWLKASVASKAYQWRMTVAVPLEPVHMIEHQFAFANPEDLALFLLTWPGHRIEQVDVEKYLELDRD